MQAASKPFCVGAPGGRLPARRPGLRRAPRVLLVQGFKDDSGTGPTVKAKFAFEHPASAAATLFNLSDRSEQAAWWCSAGLGALICERCTVPGAAGPEEWPPAASARCRHSRRWRPRQPPQFHRLHLQHSSSKQLCRALLGLIFHHTD